MSPRKLVNCMAKYVIETFPQDEFSFRMYHNTGKKTWQEIQRETGCYGLINTAYFKLKTFEVDSMTMIAGEWVKEGPWNDYGICVTEDGYLTIDTAPNAVYDYTIGLPNCYIKGKKYPTYKDKAQNGVSFVGTTADNSVVCLMSSKDDGMTTAEVCEVMLNAGCVNILRYDGSWSSQGSLGPGKDVDPSEERKAAVYLLIFRKGTPKEEPDMFKIALGAGHGINTAGKRCKKSIDPNETREWWLNDRICDYIESRLKAYEGYNLLRLDDSDDGKDDISLSVRTNAANKWGADFYLSVHHNAGINGGSGGGIVAYTHPKSSKASVEWRDALYKALIKHTGLKGNRTSPCLTENYHVLRESDMPAVILELGFMDSTTDVPIILTDEYAQQCADAIVEVIVERGKLTKKAVEEKDTIYKVQVGAFSKKENAERLMAELKSKGYQVYMVQV